MIFIGCASKQPIKSKSAIVIFKTKNMKFYDKGFIDIFKNNIHLQIFNAGFLALDLHIYKDRICKSTFKCMSAKEFNKTYLVDSYADDFLYKLFKQNKIYHKDKQNKIFIKVK